LKNDLGSWLWN